MSEAALHTPAHGPGRAALLWLSLRQQWIFFVIPLLYVATTSWFLRDVPEARVASVRALVMGMITLTLPAGLVAVFLFRLAQYALVLKPTSPTRQMIRDVGGLFSKPSAIILGLPLLAAMVIFNKGMLELKPMIPFVNPFTWDLPLADLDRSLHGGSDPWVLLQPVLGHDYVTFIISVFYNLWFLALFGCFTWFGFASRPSVNRTQFFLSYMLTWWIGGGLLAVAFSSAGPVYYSGIGLAPDPFAPLMAYLNDVDLRLPILSLDTQKLLWDGYTGKTAPIGISAFPSMHNASALLFALATWRRSRGLGIAFAVYCAIILIGSVHLGWHYAVDGYAGLLLAALCWWLSGFAARWHHARGDSRKLDEGLASL
ncbi:MAG: phosphatase PAP2 family protein [Rhizobiales bacterium]|nr:phosphatase PAP2 family protein [Hyphomicrobiales bacterium]